MSANMNSILQTLKDHGANIDAIRWFEQDGPELLPYTTLLCARSSQASFDAEFHALIGVYEWQDSPLMFLVDRDGLVDEDHFQRLRRKLALRGDAPYLGLVWPGGLTVHSLSLDRRTRQDSQVPPEAIGQSRHVTFAYLAGKRPGPAYNRRVWISDVVLTLLGDAIRALVDSGMRSEDAISLAGRALFVRFLGDRGLLPASLLPGASDPANLFSDSVRTRRTSKWLDDTFNGDLLPVSRTVFQAMSDVAFGTLADIMRRAPGGQLHLGWEKKWDYLDFAHIPVGVLSQAYEQYMREHRPQKQRKEAGFYTPRAIAELVVKAAFQPLRLEGRAHCARVLDPAVGAGVFLLASFRHLVAERWAHDKARPDTAVLREILYNQLVGFDINEEALRFAALGLYLMSIELDPEPEPVTKLRFDLNLRGRVLIKLSTGGEGAKRVEQQSHRSLGSLGAAVPSDHASRYDLVVGNPPWTTGTKLPGWSTVKDIVNRIAAERLGAQDVPGSLLPNECLDLPFIWRAMEWARPGGQIAFALHARLLFQQGDGMPDARRALFQALKVTGLINGAELRHSNVWPKIEAPFCLIFAQNQLPEVGSGFRFVSPHLEKALNGAGALRIDAANAELVTVSELAARPELFKILFRGTRLDLEVFERIVSARLESLEDYWGRLFGRSGGKANRAGNGYQRVRPSSRIRKTGDGHPGVSADYLRKLKFKELTQDAMRTVQIDRTRLGEFKEKRIHDPRPAEIFEGPLLIVHKSPPAETGRIRTGVTDAGILFNESYYGYSAATHPEGATLTRYLALVLGSRPALWWALITSGEFGFEREVVEKTTVGTTPVMPLEALSPACRSQVDDLYEAVAKDGSERAWRHVDKWVGALYGLRPGDLQIIEDTLKYNLPFAKNAESAQSWPDDVDGFRETLAAELRLWAEGGYDDVLVEVADLPADTPWTVLRIRAVGPVHPRSALGVASDTWEPILQLADILGSTELVQDAGPGQGLWLARLNQARYWSRSQARLVARRIIWSHLESLFGRPV